MKKQLKDAPLQKYGEEKQNFKDRSNLTSANKSRKPQMKLKLTVFKILHYRNAM